LRLVVDQVPHFVAGEKFEHSGSPKYPVPAALGAACALIPRSAFDSGGALSASICSWVSENGLRAQEGQLTAQQSLRHYAEQRGAEQKRGTPRSVMRLTAPTASLVWSVESTRWPVSAD